MSGTRARHRYTRLSVSIALGVVASLLVGLSLRIDLAAATGWLVGVCAYCLWTWGRLWGLSPEETAAHARMEDPSRSASDLVLLIAALASVVGVGYVLIGGHGSDILAASLGALCVAASWLLTHTVYGMRYADLYYLADTPPIDFGDEAPTYPDFAYLTFCLGMTYQISDTTLRTRALRKVVLGHTLLSYFLGAVVLACTINLVSGLASG